MRIEASSPEDYISKLPEERKEAIIKLRKEILKNIPSGFQECMGYGMIGYVVPHSLFPKGYHCDPKLPVPFANIASQKNFIAFYHMGIYANPKLLEWFVKEYPKHTDAKLDMGKGCIRFKKPEKIPFKLLGELMSKVTLKDWLNIYEREIAAGPARRAERAAAKAKATGSAEALKKTVTKPVKKTLKKIVKK